MDIIQHTLPDGGERKISLLATTRVFCNRKDFNVVSDESHGMIWLSVELWEVINSKKILSCSPAPLPLPLYPSKKQIFFSLRFKIFQRLCFIKKKFISIPKRTSFWLNATKWNKFFSESQKLSIIFCEISWLEWQIPLETKPLSSSLKSHPFSRIQTSKASLTKSLKGMHLISIF